MKEFCFFFMSRYLYEFLYGWLVSALLRANNVLVELDFLPDPHTKGRGSKKNKPKKKKTQPFGKEITLNQALQNMCGGYYKVVLNIFSFVNLSLKCLQDFHFFVFFSFSFSGNDCF